MSELVDKLRHEFQDEEYRHAYADECVNTIIATQIKVLREQRGMTQAALAKRSGMKQPRLSVLEDANYSNWSLNTLKRLARAFDLGLMVSFESFSNVIIDFEDLSREFLERPSFKDDPIFRSQAVTTSRRFRTRAHRWTQQMQEGIQGNLFMGQVIPIPEGNKSAIPPILPAGAAAQQGGTSNAIGLGAAG